MNRLSVVALATCLGLGMSPVALAKKRTAQPAAEAAVSPEAPAGEAVESGPTDPVKQFYQGLRLIETGNQAEGLKWLSKSATQGYAGAQTYLGVLYTEGRGLAKNDGEAVKWYLKAAKQGDSMAQYNLALLYDRAGNTKESTYWFAQAASQGDTRAQFELARHYESGTGVKKSMPEAYRWLLMAARDGSPTSIANRDRVAGLLSAEELQLVRQLVTQGQQPGTR